MDVGGGALDQFSRMYYGPSPGTNDSFSEMIGDERYHFKVKDTSWSYKNGVLREPPQVTLSISSHVSNNKDSLDRLRDNLRTDQAWKTPEYA